MAEALENDDLYGPGGNVLDDDFLVVAAIDFGTTFTGYAFSLKSDPRRIIMNPNWGAYKSQESYKTPTSVLLDEEGEFQAFGFKAQDQFLQASGDETSAHRQKFFHQFKMLLHQQEKISRDVTIKSLDGTTRSAIDIFSIVLREIKTHLVGKLREYLSSFDDKDIRWVLTVPAIWSDGSKRFMREAACQAGLITNMRSSQLQIALEPEAAAVYCRSLDTDNFAVETTDGDLTMPPGTKYLVVDSGGGTVDIAAHEVVEDNQARELYYPTGGDWGGIKVNAKFESILTTVLGQNVMTQFRRDSYREWWSLLNDFEVKKRGFDGFRGFNMQMPYALAAKYKELTEQNVEAAFKSAGVQGVTFKQGMMLFSAEVTRSLFEEITTAIISHLDDLLEDERMEDVRYLMMVGGFSDSPYLQKAMLRHFEQKRVHVLIPQDAALAVVKGAVIFGYNPWCIRSRISARTYGTGSVEEYDENIHPQDKVVKVDDVLYCNDIFSEFIVKGAEVRMGETKEFAYNPIKQNQTAMTFRLYSSIQEEVTYIDEEDVVEIDRMTVDIPDQTGGKSRQVIVEVKFGGTEITVTGRDPLAGDVKHRNMKLHVQ